jgi:spoIIIJ-associated protein
VDWVEASGKSLPEAKEIVLDLLGVAEDDAEFVVLSEPKAGLFGRLRGEARVQARVRPVAPPPKRGRRQKPSGRREGGDRQRGGSGPRKGSGGQAGRGDRANGTPRAEDERVSESSTVGTAEGAGSVSGANGVKTGAGGSSNRRRRGGRGGAGQGGNGAQGGGQPGERSREQQQGSGRGTGESENTMEESLTLEQQGQAATGFVAGLVREFGLDAEVGYVEIDEETVQIAAAGEDLGLLVGPRGATLSAVQDLTRTFVQRQSENRTDRILVDVGGYREKRVAALRRFTEGIVAEVKDSGDERVLEPMSPADRKVVHDTVNELDGVETRSEGTEPNRYVVIQSSN